MDYRTYASPFSWRYGRAELRSLFSEEERRKLWRAVWVALAEAQAERGLVTQAEVADLRAHAGEVDIEAALAIEREIHHDLMAEIRVFAVAGEGRRRQAAPRRHLDGYRGHGRDLPPARGARPWSARTCAACSARFATRMRQYADLVCMAFTHLQPAEPTTLGYRLAVYAQDLLIDDTNLRFVFEKLTTKGLRGAVGTAASYEHLLDHSGALGRVRSVRARAVRPASARDQHANLSAQARLSVALGAGRPGRVAFEVCRRHSHSFAAPSSAKSPNRSANRKSAVRRCRSSATRSCANASIRSRGCSSATRDVAWQNAATNYLERTLDDSANRRTILPEALLCADEIVSLARKVIDGLRVDERRIAHNLRTYGPFAGTEAVMMEAVRAGGDRQDTARIDSRRRDGSVGGARARRRQSARATPRRRTKPDGAASIPAEIRRLLDPGKHVGTAPQARALAGRSHRQLLRAFPQQRSRHSLPRMQHVNKGIEIARGKTKVLVRGIRVSRINSSSRRPTPFRPATARAATRSRARDASRRRRRRAFFACSISAGLPTHYLNGGEDDDNNEMVVRRCNMIPLEVVTRGVAAGSFVKRNPGVARGALMVPRVIEFFVKDDANHDPMIAPDAIVAQGIANPQRSRRDDRTRAADFRDSLACVAQARRAAGRSEDRIRPAGRRPRTRAARDRRRDRQRFVAHLAARARRSDARQADVPQSRQTSTTLRSRA